MEIHRKLDDDDRPKNDETTEIEKEKTAMNDNIK